ncbi:MAG: 3-phosphoshikimate 1-carboxyvinyltransferase [archaeon]|jgi:3-phosphoshikimate 1-carboxyvinyltransferase
MIINCKKSSLNGEIKIPGSKSHVVRALVIASLAEGTSKILDPLYSDDSSACISACRAFGAKIIEKDSLLEVRGIGKKPRTPVKEVYLGNSGVSTTYIAGLAAHARGPSILTGGESLSARPFEPICKGINNLGGKAESLGGSGKLPLKISGFLEGGFTEIDGVNSQPVSSLLVNCAIAKNDSEIKVINPHETPYVEMTMHWLDEQKINYKASKNFDKFEVSGGQEFKPFEKSIPADWSSACFSLCAGAIIPNSKIVLKGLDYDDSQGDKEIVNVLKKMGTNIKIEKDGTTVETSELRGTEIDLNKMPDALPILSVVACFADGETRITNVAHSRIKETDRISAMYNELKKMGANIEELPDGLLIRKSKLNGAAVNGHSDHRTIMALAIAGLNAEGSTKINTAEGISKTYPTFVDTMRKLGAKMEMV